MSEIGSSGLQKRAVVVIVDFFGVPSPLFMLLLIMVVVVHVIAIIQD